MKTIIILLVCFLFPIGMCFLLMRKKRNVWLMFLIGMLAFYVSQIVLRIPLLQFLMSQLKFSMFAMGHPLGYLLFLSISAGLFEETARLLGFACTRKRHDHIFDALAFGFGHGGIEAVLLVGLPLLGVTISMENVLLACFERLVTMMIHVAFSIIVWWGVHQHQRLRYLLLAITLHTAINAMTGLPFDILVIEGLLGAAAVGIWLCLYHWIVKKECGHAKISENHKGA